MTGGGAPRIGILAPNKRFFGATLVMVPFLADLRRLFPSAELTLLSPVDQAGILRQNGFVDNVYKCSLSMSPKAFADTLGFLKKGKFDILFTLRDKSERDWLLNILSGVECRVGFGRHWSFLSFTHSRRYEKNVYRALNYLKLAEPFRKESAVLSPLYPDYRCRTAESVWLVPCGEKAGKLWPLDNYIRLAGKIVADLDKNVVFVLGPSEEAYKNDIMGKLGGMNGKIDILSARPVKELLGEVNNCIVAVTNDCGPGHIVQISGKKAVVLFRSLSNIDEWVDRNSKNTVVLEGSGGIETIAADRVFEAVKRSIGR
ncbi:MAG: glycosyltransferase family 9 protein [Elusimicrobia bacterium]|nr:glycosyltransferase family 9 protein [Elusimicrobiota bacterium]